jgi:SAM-dependent methyltransferase
MNTLEHFFCSSWFWQRITQRQILPWVLSGARLGESVLELGAGYGAATGHLLELAPRVTSLEYDARLLGKLKTKHRGAAIAPLRGDAAALPFADASFSSAIAILMLHHLKSRELQDRTFEEVHRVLRPGGSFFALEINDGWLHRAGHYKCTFTPVTPGSAFARLTSAGFFKISVDFRRGGFRFAARKAAAETLKDRALAAASAAT